MNKLPINDTIMLPVMITTEQCKLLEYQEYCKNKANNESVTLNKAKELIYK